jgi:hypothetical protein
MSKGLAVSPRLLFTVPTDRIFPRHQSQRIQENKPFLRFGLSRDPNSRI